MIGRLLGIARRPRKLAAMETIDRVAVTCASGVAGDHKGRVIPGRQPTRQVTVLALA
nr:MOSC domain-containing protein [Sphingomonadaceae bacterium]